MAPPPIRNWSRLGLAGLVVALAGCGHTSRDTLRVTTLNLAHGRGTDNTPADAPRGEFEANLTKVADTLRCEAPDVMALQEADGPCDWSGGFDHIGFLADAAAYPYRHHGLHVEIDDDHAWHYGTALLARRALTKKGSRAFRAHPLDPKGYVTAEIDFNGRPVVVASVHLASVSPLNRRKHARRLIERLKQCEAPLIVMGDFNTTWQRSDGVLRVLTDELHLHSYEPESAAHNTFPSGHPRWRLDWILISDPLEFRTYGEWPDQISDHLGVTADLVWR